MAMSKTAKLCAMVITLCIVVPLGIGFMMPVSSTQETTYHEGEIRNITSEIRNATDNYYGAYYGDNNNAGWGLYYNFWDGITPVQHGMDPVTSVTYRVHSDYPQGFPEPTPYSPFIKTKHSPEGLGNANYSMIYNGTGTTKLSLEKYVDNVLAETTTGYTSAAYLQQSSILYLDDVKMQLDYNDTHTYYKVITESTADTTFTKYSNQPQNYVVVTSGFYLDEGAMTYWQNSFDNEEAIFNMIIKPGCIFDIGGVTVSRSIEGVLSMTKDGDTRDVGNYENAAIIFNDDGVTMLGLSAADLATNPNTRILQSVTVQDWAVSAPFERLQLVGTNTESGATKLLTLYCYSANIKVGTYSSTIDMDLNVSGYWAGMKGYTIRFTNGTTIGNDATLTVAGFKLDLYPRTATIVYNGVAYALTGATITIVNDGVRFYGYLNNANISDDLDQAEWTEIELGGHWGSIGMDAAQMMASNSDNYIWKAGLFNLDVHQFAGIGLATAALAFVGAAMIGRRSGEKVFWLLVCTGCVGAVYLVLFL